MTIAHSLAEVEHYQGSVISIGTFDGVHVAHQKIIHEVIQRARERGGRSVLVTFDPHPREVVGEKNTNGSTVAAPVALLTTHAEKLDFFSELGVDLTFVVQFTFEFSRKPFRDFYTEYIIDGIGVSEVIEGYDHGFGRDREAGPAELLALGREFGFSVVAEKQLLIDNDVVSSSLIRSSLAEGKMTKANRLLGRRYSLSGKVIEGDRRGRSLGFPTANIAISDSRKMLPGNGVYAVNARLCGKAYRGLMSIGVLPTFFDGHEKVCEVYLYDFEDDIYGETMTVECIDRIRGEKKFNSAEELVQEMNRDKIEGKRIFETAQL